MLGRGAGWLAVGGGRLSGATCMQHQPLAVLCSCSQPRTWAAASPQFTLFQMGKAAIERQARRGSACVPAMRARPRGPLCPVLSKHYDFAPLLQRARGGQRLPKRALWNRQPMWTAECLACKRLHAQHASGSPLGKPCAVQPRRPSCDTDPFTAASPPPAPAPPLLPCPQMPNLHFIPCVPVTARSFDHDVYVATSEPHGAAAGGPHGPGIGAGTPGASLQCSDVAAYPALPSPALPSPAGNIEAVVTRAAAAPHCRL